MPFDANDIESLMAKIKKGKFIMPLHISDDGKDLISLMLKVEPGKRITCQEILKHKWIVSRTSGAKRCNHDHGIGLHPSLV